MVQWLRLGAPKAGPQFQPWSEIRSSTKSSQVTTKAWCSQISKIVFLIFEKLYQNSIDCRELGCMSKEGGSYLDTDGTAFDGCRD